MPPHGALSFLGEAHRIKSEDLHKISSRSPGRCSNFPFHSLLFGTRSLCSGELPYCGARHGCLEPVVQLLSNPRNPHLPECNKVRPLQPPHVRSPINASQFPMGWHCPRIRQMTLADWAFSPSTQA